MFSISIPKVIVRTFQLPNLRVRLFLRLCLSSDSLSVYFLLLQLIPMHPLRKVNCGGTTLYCLRGAPLKASGGCSLESKHSSYRRKRPMASIFFLNRIIIITGNCRFPCCVSQQTCETGVTSLSTNPGHKVEITVVAHAAGSYFLQ